MDRAIAALITLGLAAAALRMQHRAPASTHAPRPKAADAPPAQQPPSISAASAAVESRQSRSG